MSGPSSLYLVDCGADDLRVVREALSQVGIQVEVGADPARLASASTLALTGTGTFGATLDRLEAAGVVEPLRAALEAGVPLLGIGVGLHLLFEGSEEAPGRRGLGIVAGDVRALPATVELPHRGEGPVEFLQDSPLLEGIPDCSPFYFEHDYAVVPRGPSAVLTVTDYQGVSFVSAVALDRIVAVQFHPERSGSLGLRFLQNFARHVGLEVDS